MKNRKCMVAELMQIKYNNILFWLIQINSDFYLFCDDVLCITLNTENELIVIFIYL
jgi:hypothetical protein